MSASVEMRFGGGGARKGPRSAWMEWLEVRWRGVVLMGEGERRS